MENKYFIINFVLFILVCFGSILYGEVMLSILLTMLPVYFLFYAIYLLLNFKKISAVSKGVIFFPLISFIIFLLLLSYVVIFFEKIDNYVLSDKEICESYPSNSSFYIKRYFLVKNYIIQKKDGCVLIVSPSYSLIKIEPYSCKCLNFVR